MEQSDGLTVKIYLSILTNPNHKPLTQKIISYLSVEDLEMLGNVLEKSQGENVFRQLIKTSYFLKKYLNGVDRSFYNNFYEKKQYLDLEDSHLLCLANSSNCFLTFPKQFNHLLAYVKNMLPDLLETDALLEQLQRMIIDTDIPLPKLKRQNQGMFCKTSFQNFLIALKYRNTEYQEGIPCFDELKETFQAQDQIYLTQVFLKFKKQDCLNKNNLSIHKKILTLRFTPYEILYENYEKFLIQNCSLHNFLVCIYAITDLWLNSICSYLESLDDPFHQYVELITRYSIYRNFVIQVQQTLCFSFQQYNQLYSEVFDAEKPQYRFWRAAMTKWLLKFSKFHSQSQQIYYYCFNKLRTNKLLQFLTEKEAEEPEIYMPIRNKISLREYEIDVNEKAFPTQTSNGVEDFFRNNSEQYQVLTIEFMEYMIDLSVNEQTVHWCGHSQQQLSEPFTVFEKFLLEKNREFLKYLRKCCEKQEIRQIFSREYFTSEICYLQYLEIKPMTLRKFVQYSNLEIVDNPTLTENVQLVHYNYESNDDLLKYFNTKANIKFYINAEELIFYSINPLVSSDELLTKSTNSTNFTINDNQDEDGSQCCFEYCSESSSVEDYERQANMESLDSIQEDVLKSQQLKSFSGGLSKKMSMKWEDSEKPKRKEKCIENPYGLKQQEDSKKQQKKQTEKGKDNKQSPKSVDPSLGP